MKLLRQDGLARVQSALTVPATGLEYQSPGARARCGLTREKIAKQWTFKYADEPHS
jgi:hypothetical protein